MTSEQRTRTLDVVVYGATGFVGRLVADTSHAARRAVPASAWRAARSTVSNGVRGNWSRPRRIGRFCGRREGRAVGRCEISPAATHVVATTVGPYAKYGLPLVAACAEAGTDYVDLTGEDALRAGEHRPLPRPRRREWRPNRPLVRIRLDPFGSRRTRAAPARPGGRCR